MKLLNKNIFWSVTILIMGLTSCLKDTAPVADPSAGTNNVVEFQNSNIPNSYTSIYPQYVNDLKNLTKVGTDTFNVNINWAGAQYNAPQDINVTISVDAASLTAFNNDQGTNYVLPPTAIYSVPLTATIKAGTPQTTIKVVITNGASYDFSKSYALPLKIVTSSYGLISTNFGTAIYSFSARNKYDGHYTLTGTMVDAANAGLGGYYPNDVDLVTTGAAQVAMYDNTIGGYYHAILSGSSLSYYGSFGVVFNFDANDNVSSVINKYGQPASNGRLCTIDPSGVNKWNSTTHNLTVKYWMDQPSVITPHRTSFNELYTYVGPR